MRACHFNHLFCSQAKKNEYKYQWDLQEFSIILKRTPIQSNLGRFQGSSSMQRVTRVRREERMRDQPKAYRLYAFRNILEEISFLEQIQRYLRWEYQSSLLLKISQQMIIPKANESCFYENYKVEMTLLWSLLQYLAQISGATYGKVKPGQQSKQMMILPLGQTSLWQAQPKSNILVMSCLHTIILIGFRSKCTISYLIRCLIPQMMLSSKQSLVLKEIVALLTLTKTSNGSPFIISIKRPLFNPQDYFVPQYFGRKYVILPLNFTTMFFQCYNFGSRRSESSLILFMATIFQIFSSWVLELFLSQEFTKLMMTFARCMQQEPPQAMGLMDFSFTSALTILYTKSSTFFSPIFFTCREFLYFRWWQSLRCMRLSFTHCELFSLNLKQQSESILLQSCFSTIIFSHIFLSCAFCFFNLAQP